MYEDGEGALMGLVITNKEQNVTLVRIPISERNKRSYCVLGFRMRGAFDVLSTVDNLHRTTFFDRLRFNPPRDRDRGTAVAEPKSRLNHTAELLSRPDALPSLRWRTEKLSDD